MKSLRSTMLVAGACGLIVLTAACAKPPAAEIDAAKAALSGAREAEAATYASAQWDEAQNAMAAADTEIAAQAAKFALMRSYTKAEQLLTAAETSGRAAEVAAEAGRERALNDATNALNQAKADLEAATALLAELESCRRKPKGFAQDLELLQGTLQGLAASIPDIELALEEGQLIDAHKLAVSLSGEINAFSQELESAKTKIKC